MFSVIAYGRSCVLGTSSDRTAPWYTCSHDQEHVLCQCCFQPMPKNWSSVIPAQSIPPQKCRYLVLHYRTILGASIAITGIWCSLFISAQEVKKFFKLVEDLQASLLIVIKLFLLRELNAGLSIKAGYWQFTSCYPASCHHLFSLCF